MLSRNDVEAHSDGFFTAQLRALSPTGLLTATLNPPVALHPVMTGESLRLPNVPGAGTASHSGEHLLRSVEWSFVAWRFSARSPQQSA
jgi:hypothetical protein